MLFAILVVELELSQQHIAQKLGHYPEIQIIMLITIEADFQVFFCNRLAIITTYDLPALV